jgi:hypothetical protein
MADDEPREPEGAERMTVRERRAQHAREQARKQAPKTLARKAFVPALVILLIAAVAVGFYTTSKGAQDCPGHWHAAYSVVVDGKDLQFTHPNFQNPPDGSHDYHIHANDHILHYHPAVVRCIELEDMMKRLGVEPTDSRLVLASTHGADAGTYEANETHVVRIFHQPWEGTWQQVTWRSIKDDQLGNGDKILIYYGVDDEEAFEAARLAVPDLPPNYQPPA